MPASVPAHFSHTNQLVRPGRDAGPYRFSQSAAVQKVKNSGNWYNRSSVLLHQNLLQQLFECSQTIENVLAHVNLDGTAAVLTQRLQIA